MLVHLKNIDRDIYFFLLNIFICIILVVTVILICSDQRLVREKVILRKEKQKNSATNVFPGNSLDENLARNRKLLHNYMTFLLAPMAHCLWL